MLDNKPNALQLIRKMEARFREDQSQLLWRGASLRDSTRRMPPKTERTETDQVDGEVNNDDILYDECEDTFVIERASKINLIP